MNDSELFKRVNVRAGDGCEIHPACSLENVVLGKGVRVANGVQLWNVVVGDRAKISRNVTFYTNSADQPIRIGVACWISYGVFGEGTGGEISIGDHSVVAHSTTLLTSSGPGLNSPILVRLYPDQFGSIRVGPHCWVGAHCVLLPDVALPEGVIVGANSTLKAARYEAWSVYGGSPAKLLKRLEASAVAAARAEWAAATGQ